MKSYKEWFSYLEKPMQPGVVATGDDSLHPIANVGEVPLSHVGKKGKLMNMLHIPTITKNLASVGHIVDREMQVRFMHLGCFIEEEDRVIAQGRRGGRIFILDTSDGGTAMFAKGQKVESDIDLWHKRIGHVNYQRLQDLQTKQVVFGLPKFSGQEAQICEACQLGKQHRLSFPNESNQSKNKLDLIHSMSVSFLVKSNFSIF